LGCHFYSAPFGLTEKPNAVLLRIVTACEHDSWRNGGSLLSILFAVPPAALLVIPVADCSVVWSAVDHSAYPHNADPDPFRRPDPL
ncbi:MAG: hypothetical protein ABL904_28295, partial [Hyphomicrobiaceae bacterium]